MNKIVAFTLLICHFCIASVATAQTVRSDSLTKLPDPEMVLVDGGTFTMGFVPEPDGRGGGKTVSVHQVTLSSFRIGKYEIDQAEWKSVMGTNLSLHQGCDNCPVEEVSWNDIQLFIRTLNEKTGRRYQLPTEAQWEFAARGGNKSKGYKYAGSNDIDEVAWYAGEYIDSTHSVGRKSPNELGIYDMTGNVEEWCNDWFDPSSYFNPPPQTDPQGPLSGTGHVIRGGSWGFAPPECHVTRGHIGYPDDRNAHVGFRLVLAN